METSMAFTDPLVTSIGGVAHNFNVVTISANGKIRIDAGRAFNAPRTLEINHQKSVVQKGKPYFQNRHLLKVVDSSVVAADGTVLPIIYTQTLAVPDHASVTEALVLEIFDLRDDVLDSTAKIQQWLRGES